MLVLGLQDLLLGLHHGLALFALGAFIGLINDAGSLLLGGADLLLGGLLPTLNAYRDTYRQTDHDTDDRSDDIG